DGCGRCVGSRELTDAARVTEAIDADRPNGVLQPQQRGVEMLDIGVGLERSAIDPVLETLNRLGQSACAGVEIGDQSRLTEQTSQAWRSPQQSVDREQMLEGALEVVRDLLLGPSSFG